MTLAEAQALEARVAAFEAELDEVCKRHGVRVEATHDNPSGYVDREPGWDGYIEWRLPRAASVVLHVEASRVTRERQAARDAEFAANRPLVGRLRAEADARLAEAARRRKEKGPK